MEERLLNKYLEEIGREKLLTADEEQQLSPSFYEFFYVHRKHTASTDIDTIFPKRLHGFNFFLQFKLRQSQRRGRLSENIM